jgi:peptide/nickel transport system permease protein
VNVDDIRLDEYSYISVVSFASNIVILKVPYLRRSYTTGEKVSEMIAMVLPSTAILALSALVIAIFLGLSLGILSALYHTKWIDHSISAFSILCYAIPSYISAILFALVFGYTLHAWTGLPVQGSLFNLDDYGNEYFDFRYLILPSLALGIRPIAMISQMTRASLLENFSKDYVRTALSLGLSNKRVLLKHIIPNAWSPIITTVSGWFASLLTGAFFVEFVFNYRGMGDLTIQSLAQFDLPVILACCITTICIFVFINTLADIANAVMDPRIKI